MDNYISNAIIFLTHKCNLRCPYCFEDHNRIEDVSLDFIDTFYNFVKGSHTLPNTRIEMFGGEPTLNREAFIYALKTYWNDDKIPGGFYSMTNGTLLTEDYIQEIYNIISNKKSNKSFLFYISIDDIDSSTKNLYNIKEALNLLNQYHIGFTIQTVISKTNYNHLYEFVKEALKYNPVNINLRRLCNTSVWNQEEIYIIEDQCKRIIDNLNYECVVFPGKYSISKRRIMDAPCASKQHNKYTTYFIDVDGAIYPCEVCASHRKFSMGSIYDPDNIKPKKFEVDYYNPTACMLSKYPGNQLYEDMCDRITNYLIRRNLSVFFEITDKCNYQCSFCCKLWRQEKTGYITDKVLDKIIDLNAKCYTIAGGEPCLEKERVHYFVKNTYKNSHLTLNTNLSLWNKDDIESFNVRNVHFTIDFPCYNKEIYKKIVQTNDWTYNNVLKNLSYVNKERSRIHIVVNNDNRNFWAQTILWLASFYEFKVFVVTPSISFNMPDDRKSIFKEIKKFSDIHKNLIIMTLSKTEDNDYVPVNHTCTAGIDRFVVLSDGNVVPCAWSRNHIIGNIINSSIDDILINGRKYFYSYPYEKIDICKGILDARDTK